MNTNHQTTSVQPDLVPYETNVISSRARELGLNFVPLIDSCEKASLPFTLWDKDLGLIRIASLRNSPFITQSTPSNSLTYPPPKQAYLSSI